jgi:hypothetical protein
MMPVEEFDASVARIRDRFASALHGKIVDAFAALDKMSAGGADAIELAITMHRRLHEMYGVAPTLGFDTTGEAAAIARAAIRDAAKAKRATTPTEICHLKSALERLREAAAADLRRYSTREKSNVP